MWQLSQTLPPIYLFDAIEKGEVLQYIMEAMNFTSSISGPPPALLHSDDAN